MSMETIKDYSYGVIPLRKEEGQWMVFLINQIPRRGNIFWTYPKGHPEKEETNEETALRELLEETGIVPDTFVPDKTFIQEYTFTHGDQRIEKRVLYYPGFVESDVFTIQPDEIHEAKWCTFSEARNLLTHDIAKGLLDEVEVYLEDN